MIFSFGGDGPVFSLNMDDVMEIREKGHLDVFNEYPRINQFLHARLSLVDHDPNEITYPNGYVTLRDGMCNSGFRLRRYPDGICPHDYKGHQYYVLRVQRSVFEEMVVVGQNRSDKIGYIHPRCKYDRFALRIDC